MEKSIHELKVEFMHLILWENRELTNVVRGRSFNGPFQFKLVNIFRKWVSQRKFLLFCEDPAVLI